MGGVLPLRATSGAPVRRAVGAGRAWPLLLLAACAPSVPPAPPLPQAETERVVAGLESSARLTRPTQIRFDWAIREQSARTGGQGVARAEPPYRARLDLFLGDGTTAGLAALVDETLRVPQGLPPEVVPPPALLWAALGTFRPGRESTLLGARERDGEVELRYARPGGQELRYRVRDGRIRLVELVEGGNTVDEVTITPGEQPPFPREARYRNLRATRELTLTTRSIEYVDGFPSDIWDPRP